MKVRKAKKAYPGAWVVRLAAVLLCLSALSTGMVANLFARYTTSGRGADAARVAGFTTVSIEAEPTPDTALNYGQTISKRAMVNVTESEVAFRLSLDVQMIDGRFTYAIADGWNAGGSTVEGGYVISHYYRDVPAGVSGSFPVFENDEITSTGFADGMDASAAMTLSATAVQLD